MSGPVGWKDLCRIPEDGDRDGCKKWKGRKEEEELEIGAGFSAKLSLWPRSPAPYKV